MKQCIKCGSTNSLTRDHIIPRWFMITYFMLTGQTFQKFLTVRGMHQYKNFQTMCYDCNQAKRGTLDFSNDIVKSMSKEIIASLQKYV